MDELKKKIEQANSEIRQLRSQEDSILDELYPSRIIKRQIDGINADIKNKQQEISKLNGDDDINFPGGPVKKFERAKKALEEQKEFVKDLKSKIEEQKRIDTERLEEVKSKQEIQNLPMTVEKDSFFRRAIRRIPFLGKLLKPKNQIANDSLINNDNATNNDDIVYDSSDFWNLVHPDDQHESSHMNILKQNLRSAELELQSKQEEFDNAQIEYEKHQQKYKANEPKIAEIQAKCETLEDQKQLLTDQMNKIESTLTEDEKQEKKNQITDIHKKCDKLFEIIDENEAKIKAENPNYITRKDIANFALSRLGSVSQNLSGTKGTEPEPEK